MTIPFKKYAMLIMSCLILTTGFGQKFDFFKVIAGIGIVYNNDSILIERTSIERTCEILEVLDQSNSDEVMIRDWSGFDSETFEDTSGTEWVKKIQHKSLEFEFTSENSIDSLKLRSINIKMDESIKTYTDTGLIIGEINPNISAIYPKASRRDYVSENELIYELYSHGISFKLENVENKKKRLTEISVHYKID